MIKEATPNINVLPRDADIPPETFRELQAKHGAVWYRRSAGGVYEFVLKCPSDFAFRRYQLDQKEGKAEWDAAEDLAIDCAVWPDDAEVRRRFEARPMLKKAVAEWGAMIGTGAYDAAEKKA